MILSGMNAAEVGEIIGAYRDAGKGHTCCCPASGVMLHLFCASLFPLYMCLGMHVTFPVLPIASNKHRIALIFFEACTWLYDL